jgi:hypothetical protein
VKTVNVNLDNQFGTQEFIATELEKQLLRDTESQPTPHIRKREQDTDGEAKALDGGEVS